MKKPQQIEVLLPIALPKAIAYYVPEALQGKISIGMRVEVQLGGKKRYAGIITGLSPEVPSHIRTKPILSIIDEKPIIHPAQIAFWKWLASYYCCTPGQVMQAALPSALKLASETRIILHPDFDLDNPQLTDDEYLVLEALHIEHELNIGQIRDIIQRKEVNTVIRQLFIKGAILVRETLKEKHRPKTIQLIEWHPDYLPYEERVLEALEAVRRSEKQTRTLLALIQLANTQPYVRKEDLYLKAEINAAVLNALEKKKIIVRKNIPAWKLRNKSSRFDLPDQPLSPLQAEKLQEINTAWENHQVVLLNGITGSGKTHLYVHSIFRQLDKTPDGQVLYLLPEIALTTQITYRLKKVFGDRLLVYHSGMSDSERVEVWQSVLDGHPIVLGARSAIFLPFHNLKLIIVDEEHDPSYKQVNPSPRYNARDAATYLGRLYDAKVLLGTATPSVESYFNVRQGKYGYVELSERHSGVRMPEIEIIDLKKAQKDKQLNDDLAVGLVEQIGETLESGKQVLLFKNRRGYTPVVSCKLCGWTAECVRCDVSLTYHMYYDEMRCHYCGFREKLPKACPNCGHHDVLLKGYGTERLEEILKSTFPGVPIGRMDFDTAHTKRTRERIIEAFELNEFKVLVGTQMITKGLDFDNIGLVGVIGTDQILHHPDFRSNERAFQILTQVSGRAGRQEEQGKVVIQVYNTKHPVLQHVIQQDFFSFYKSEINEREQYQYPPFYRLINITFLHKNKDSSHHCARLMRDTLIPRYGKRILGPTPGGIPRIRGKYIFNILVKIERNAALIRKIKADILTASNTIRKNKGLSGVRINIDVDPY